MPDPESPAMGVDATPLATGHAVRGIGRYLGGVLTAVAIVEPDWTRANLGLLLLPRQEAPIAGSIWRTRRSRLRPQDLDPLIALAADRLAIRGRRPSAWHHTDPTNPSSPIPPSRTIVTVYDLIPLRDTAVMGSIRPHRRAAYRRYLRLVRSASGIVAISGSTATDLIELLGIEPERIRIVPPHVPAPGAGKSEPAGATADARARFLFVGVPEPHKRPMLAIEAFAKVVQSGIDAEFVFAGIHPAALREGLRQRVATLGLGSRVRYLDRIDDGDLTRRYASSVLVATSSIEGFGLPLVEAILAGGRVAATPTAAYRDAVDDAATFAADDSAGAMADAMALALDRPSSDADRARLAARFSATATSAALMTAYRDLAGV